MSENDDQKPDDTATGPDVQPDAPKPGDERQEPDEQHQDDPETFTREYVQELRAESAKHRTNSKRADNLAAALVASYVDSTGRLHDPSDLPVTDDLLTDGMPDRDKISAAVDALVKAKPHLARIRPVGDVGQGHQGEQTTSGLAAFGSMLRDAAS